jgi:hypothetical protein
MNLKTVHQRYLSKYKEDLLFNIDNSKIISRKKKSY